MIKTAARLEALSPQERGLALEKLRRKKSGKLAYPAIPRLAGSRDSLPLSWAQERLWFVSQLQPDNAFENVPLAIRITGPLDIDALTQALREVVERHETLRTNFRSVSGNPFAFIADYAPLHLPVTDLTSDPDAQIEKVVRRETSIGFDLEHESPIRARLLKLKHNGHVLVVTMHHIVSDAWSKGVLLQELALAYRALRNGQPSPLPPLPIQYSDYARWQRTLLDGATFEREMDYWRKRLANAPSLLELPVDHPAALVNESHPCERFHFSLPPSLMGGLNDLARQSGATLFMVLMAGFQVLLSRYSGQSCIVTGAPVSGRWSIETENLIGVFLNALPICTDLAGNPRFLDVLQSVRAAVIEAHEQQRVPFEKMVHALQPSRASGQHPIFQTAYIAENKSSASYSLDGLQFESLNVDRQGVYTPYHLTLCTGEEDRELIGAIEYATDLFEPATIRTLTHRFETLLQELVRDPSQRVEEIPLDSPDERKISLQLCCGVQTAERVAENLYEKFDRQAQETPQAIALISGGETWTFEALRNRANGIASYLQSEGVELDDVVAVAAERSPSCIAAMLGVLSAGAAYLALDLEYPAERIAYMLEDAGVKLALATADGKAALQRASTSRRIVELDAIDSKNEKPRKSIRRANLAYVTYTSGSTGQPKGVMGTHEATLNRFAWMWTGYPFVSGDVCCHKTSVSFVDSVWEIWGPLLAGVPLVIPSGQSARDPRALIEVLEQNRVTRLVVVPSLLRVLLDEPDLNKRLSTLKLWTVSGEELPPQVAQAFHAKLPGRTLLNLYGSSEVAADVSWFEVPVASESAAVPVGRPIANTQIYVLDRHMHPVSTGIVGDIYAGGLCLARGYMRNPALTAERFVPDPFDESARLYRTGDRGRYRSDGSLEYVGRADNQVKIRGHRIELGEVERAIESHPAVSKTCVLGEEIHGERQLIAFVTPAGEPPEAAELRSFLDVRIPGYMIPFVWKIRESLPFLRNGKLDRKALGLLARTELQTVADDSEPPATEVEEAIAGIWRDLLGVASVGRNRNFFDIGGHSLLAIRVTAKIYSQFSVEITLREFFDSPTVARLAERIEQELWSGVDSERLEQLLKAVEAGEQPELV